MNEAGPRSRGIAEVRLGSPSVKRVGAGHCARRGRAGATACVLIAVLLVVAGCGAAGATTSKHVAIARRAHRRSSRSATLGLTYRELYSLAAPLRDPAFAALGGDRFVMLGGLDAADVSSAGIELADTHRVLDTATLPGPQHDAQGASLGSRVYVFGGGDVSQLSHILAYDPASGAVSPVGALRVAQSDVAVARSGGEAYVVGGFDGANYLDTIVGWHPGGAPTVEAHLPVGLRYAAVAVADGGLLVIGGSTPAGASDAVYRFDLATHAVRRLASLPHPVTHAGAATLGSSVYVVGGRGDAVNGQTDAVWAIDPTTGGIRAAGRLPRPISDAAVLTLGPAIVVAGGQSPSGTLAGVGELVPAGSG